MQHLQKTGGGGPVMANRLQFDAPVAHPFRGEDSLCFNFQLSTSYALSSAGHGTRITGHGLSLLPSAPADSSQTRTASHPATTTARSSFPVRQTTLPAP